MWVLRVTTLPPTQHRLPQSHHPWHKPLNSLFNSQAFADGNTYSTYRLCRPSVTCIEMALPTSKSAVMAHVFASLVFADLLPLSILPHWPQFFNLFFSAHSLFCYVKYPTKKIRTINDHAKSATITNTPYSMNIRHC